MTDPEYTKDFLRRMHNEGLLDLSASLEDLETFVRIFAGDIQALVAIQNSSLIETPEDLEKVLRVAKPTAETTSALKDWNRQVGWSA